MNSNFHSIDIKTWPRSQYFYYFTKMLPTGFNLNAEIDVTAAYYALKKQNKKFFPAYLFLTTKLINKEPYFKIAYQNEQLGYYEVLNPSYACFHEDDQTMSNMWTVYDEDFNTFYNNYIEDQKQYGKNHGILAKPEMPPANSFMVGVIPWISFKSYSPIPFGFGEITNFFPILEAGKFYEKDNKLLMPLSMTVHHAIADGYQVSAFFNALQVEMNYPENWMNS